MQPSLRYMALDVGNIRVGVALSDTSGAITAPYPILRRHPELALKQAILRLAKEEHVVKIIVGLPLHEDGSSSEQSEITERFSERLADFVKPLPIELWNEFGSTQDAKYTLQEMGEPRKNWAKLLDSVAASIILQNYLRMHDHTQ